MRILILGASGLLGWDFYQHLADRYAILGTFNKSRKVAKRGRFDQLDISKPLTSQFPFSFDIVINCVGLTNVDYCEAHQEEAKRVNTDFVENILDYCNRYNSFLIHISSDYIYSGKDLIVKENTVPCPQNYYGQTKLLSEEILKDYENKTIIRPSKLYNYEFCKHYKMNEGGFDDFIIKYPLWTKDIVYNFDKWINHPDTYNISSLMPLTKYQWVKRILRAFQFERDIHPEPYEWRTKRPFNVKYDLAKINKLGVIPHSVDDAIRWEQTYESKNLQG